MKKPLTHIVIHCSASPFGCVKVIRQWHLEKGWKDIGYHFVIMNGRPWSSHEYLMSLDGRTEIGRFLDGDNFIDDNEVGAHTLGYNDHSIGICLVGPGPKTTKPETSFYDKLVNKAISAPGFTQWQIGNLASLCRDLMRLHNIPVMNVIGHNETASGMKEGKTCPEFDVSQLRELLKPYFV